MISGISGSTGLAQMSSLRSQMENPFEKMDANGDGALDETELVSMAAKLSEMTGQTVNASQIISDLDSDGNGLVDQEEFTAGRPAGPPPGMMEMMSGNLQGNTIQSLLDTGNGAEGDSASDSTDPLDTNGDGFVDAEEALSGRKSLFQQYQIRMISMLTPETEAGSQVNLLT